MGERVESIRLGTLRAKLSVVFLKTILLLLKLTFTYQFFYFSCTRPLLLCTGLSLVVTRRLLGALASLVTERGLLGAGSVVGCEGLVAP